MKKIKFIAPILGVSSIACGLIPLVGCSKSTSMITLSSKSHFARRVSASYKTLTYYFACKDVEQAQNYKAQVINMRVNYADATVVEGLCRTRSDAAGNIVVVIDTTKLQHYGNVEYLVFDLQFTNKVTNDSIVIGHFATKFLEAEEVVEDVVEEEHQEEPAEEEGGSAASEATEESTEQAATPDESWIDLFSDDGEFYDFTQSLLQGELNADIVTPFVLNLEDLASDATPTIAFKQLTDDMGWSKETGYHIRFKDSLIWQMFSGTLPDVAYNAGCENPDTFFSVDLTGIELPIDICTDEDQGVEAFSGLESLRSISLDCDNIYTIENNYGAFADCINLYTVDLQGSNGTGITEIPANTFVNCYSLTEINIAPCIKTFAPYCFAGAFEYVSVDDIQITDNKGEDAQWVLLDEEGQPTSEQFTMKDVMENQELKENVFASLYGGCGLQRVTE